MSTITLLQRFNYVIYLIDVQYILQLFFIIFFYYYDVLLMPKTWFLFYNSVKINLILYRPKIWRRCYNVTDTWQMRRNMTLQQRNINVIKNNNNVVLTSVLRRIWRDVKLHSHNVATTSYLRNVSHDLPATNT